MSTLFINHRVTHLRFAVIFEWIRYSDRITGHHEGCFRKEPKLFRYIEITQGVFVNVCLLIELTNIKEIKCFINSLSVNFN
jgi:hypothetical protein